MTTKSIIDIDVNDQQFKSFYELFQQYKADVGKMPETWQELDASIKRAGSSSASTGRTTAAMGAASAEALGLAAHHAQAMADQLKKATTAQKQFHTVSRGSAVTLKKMATEAGNLGKSLFGIGKYLLKFGAIGGGISALGTLFSFAGLRDLGQMAVSNQRSARGLGIQTGQYRAFEMDFGRYLGSNTLSNVANAQNSYTGRVWLSRATGMPLQQITSEGPDRIAAQLAMKAHDWWKNTPAQMRTQENLQASGFTQSGFTLEDMRRLGNTSRAALLTAQQQYARDQKTLQIPDEATRAWYGFVRELKLAGAAIATDLTNKLAELAPHLRTFVSVLTKDAEALINGALKPENLRAFEHGLEDVAKYLGSPEFRKNLKDFGQAIMDVTNLILKVAGWLKNPPGHTETITAKPPNALPGSTPLSALPNHTTVPKLEPHGKTRVAPNVPSYAEHILPSPINSIPLTGGPSYAERILPSPITSIPLTGNVPIWKRLHNLGNLRGAPGTNSVNTRSGKFAQFASEQDSLKAMAWTLSGPAYHGTLSQIIGTYAPSSENNTAAYIAAVAKDSGIKPGQVIDKTDPAVMSKLIAAMVRQETGQRISPQEVEQNIAQSKWNAPSRTDFSRLLSNLTRRQKPTIQLNVTGAAGAQVAVSANALGY
ncbi:MAG TPA: hypothetical protein PLK99_00025 [Burkholderiales bacterium]|nr:hypothetical protein [Burkholderiales bacterium]